MLSAAPEIGVRPRKSTPSTSNTTAFPSLSEEEHEEAEVRNERTANDDDLADERTDAAALRLQPIDLILARL
jgi:hypothetical protein